MASNITITDAVSLWNSFCTTAHFDDNEYDAELEHQVRCALGLSVTGQMTDLLKKNAISVENLLAAVLNAMQPFSQMLNDLLCMFEKASAQYSNTNLQIQFNFKENDQPFQFDLENFRKTVHISTSLKKNINLIGEPWTLIDAFDIFRCRYFCNRPQIASSNICQWLDEYENDTWPNFLPEVPTAGIESLDKTIRQIWTMVVNAIGYYKQAYDPDKGRRQSHCDEYRHHPDDFLWQAEIDFWVGCFIRTATYTIEHLGELTPEERVATAQNLEAKLLSFMALHKITTIEIETIVDCLEDILSLPFWKKRHELYAAWILVQITDALKDTDVQFHAPNGILSFSFRATLMATCKKLDPPLEIWSELRTESSSMMSKKRKAHIQPDYTLAVQDTTDPNNTVAVVECKQYKKANRKNFFEAIVDYANGRPQGRIFLVNYGPIPKNMLDNTVACRGRAFPFEMICPGEKTVSCFCEKLLSEVLKYYRESFNRARPFMYPWQNAKAECFIQLTWHRIPKDLDLYLRISTASGMTQTVCFSSPGSKNGMPYAELDCDCRSGYGCETIHIVNWQDTEYDIIIDNYSGEQEIDGTITVSISCGPDHYSCSCTKPWSSPFAWHVFRLNSLGFQVINRCIRRTS